MYKPVICIKGIRSKNFPPKEIQPINVSKMIPWAPKYNATQKESALKVSIHKVSKIDTWPKHFPPKKFPNVETLGILLKGIYYHFIVLYK